jgi:hypothetical protein
VGTGASVEADAARHSSATVSATAAAIAGTVSDITTARTARDRASLKSRLAVTTTAKAHHPTSARLGLSGKPMTP